MYPNKPIKTRSENMQRTSAETRARKLWSISVFRPFSEPNSDRRVILLSEETFCSHVNGLASFERKWRKSWLAQGIELE